jgi:hypothetical protein
MNEPEYVFAWEQLREWTIWLIGRYRLTLEDRLPTCWPQHPEVIEELWALRAWRAEAYGSEGTGQAAVYWHQALITFLTHVSSWWAGGCRAGHASPDTGLTPQQTSAWAAADPLSGIPQPLRPTASIRTNPPTDQGAITMPDLNTLTSAQMGTLTKAGLAHPQHETIAAFTYYDGSWWAFASRKGDDSDAADEDDEGTMWFRADDVDLASDGTFYLQPIAANWRDHSNNTRSRGTMSTTEPQPAKVDHRPYIETVRIALLLQDLHVGVASFNSGTVRSAAMTLLPPDVDFEDPWAQTFARAEQVQLRWSEEDGWSLLALHTSDEGPLPTIWRRGFGVVLPPDEICAWLDLLLTMPALSSSQEDGPYRTHQKHDPAFEASLAAYAL